LVRETPQECASETDPNFGRANAVSYGQTFSFSLHRSSELQLEFMQYMQRLCAFAMFVLLVSSCCFAWGPEAHRVIADVAHDHLSTLAQRAVLQLLGDDDLAAISTWADEVRRERRETYGWHFVDIPWNASGFDERRDCYHPNGKFPSTVSDHRNCIVDRIEIFKSVLADHHASRSDRIEALKFLVHFVADLHQPLHAIAQAKGGNDVHVVQFGSAECGSRPCDLHGTWDIGLIEHAHRSERDYADLLEQLIARQKLDLRAGGTPHQWANESFRIAHQVWMSDGSSIDENYYRRNIHFVDEQLALAGLRLAKLLNEALEK